MAQPISLDDPQTQAPPSISLDTEGQTPSNLPADVVDKRARKAEFGLGPITGVTKDAAQEAISTGQEMGLRRSSALAIDMQKSDQKAKLIQEMATRQGGSITEGQLGFVNSKESLSNLMGQEPATNPDSVLEEYYAGQYMKPMYDISDQFNQGSFMPEAQKEIPEHVAAIKATSQNLTAAREMIKTRLENSRAALEDQSYLGRAADFTKELFPGYTESALKGGWSQIFEGGARGTAMRQQARDLWAMSPDKLRDTFNTRMDYLDKKDPALAVEYGEHMLGFSTSEENLQNFFTGLDVASIPAVGIGKALLKGGSAAIRGAASVTGVTDLLAKKAELFNATTTAAKDAVKSTEGEGIPLRVLRNQHFGQESARLSYEMDQSKKEYKRIVTADIGPATTYQRLGEAQVLSKPEFANEGLRAQAATREFNNYKNLHEQLESLKTWHADNSIEGSQGEILVNQVDKEDPAVTSASGRGDLKTAATEKVTAQVSQEARDPANVPKNTIEALTDSMRGDIIKETADAGHGGQEIVNRLREGGEAFIKKLQNAAQNIMRVQRIPGILANKEALKAIIEYQKDLFPGIRNAILNVSDPIHNPAFNTYTQQMFFGRMTGEIFASKEEAEAFADSHGLTGIAEDPTKQGLGWHFSVEKPIDETMHPIRDWLIKSKESVTPGGWLNAAVGWLRTPEDTLSAEQNMQRKLATYNVAPFMTFAKDSLKDIRSLGGFKNIKDWYAQWKDWERAVDYARDAPVPGSTTGEKGYFFETGQQLDDFWMRNFDNKLPTIAQKAAYFQFKRIIEYDRVLRSMAMYRNKTRLGTESHSISTIINGEKVKSPFFDGRVEKTLPGGVANIWVVDRGKDAIYTASTMGNMRENLVEAIEKGELKVIQLYSPSQRPLQGFAGADDSLIRYVVVRNTETKPINITEQLPRKGGGHFDYAYDHYIKQANISFDPRSLVHTYEGDNTLMPVGVRAMGRDVVTRLNKVRELIRDNKLEEAKAFAMSPQGVPDIPWETHQGWYLATKDAAGNTIKPRLSKNEELRVVPQNKMISDMDNSMQERFEAMGHSFQDVNKQGSLEAGNSVQYARPRDVYDMMTLRDTGTKGNPIYTYEPAKFVDPITTMNRSVSRIVNSTLMDDYKIYSVESWIQEAKNWLKVGNRSLDDITRSPFYYFNNPEWKTAMPEDMKARLMGSRLKINQLVGMPSSTDTFLHSAQQALADSIYGKLGPKAVELTPSWLLPSLRDPTKFLRSVVFNEKMGLFSIPQFFVHAMTFANVMGIAGPKNGTVGAMGALFHGFSTMNKNPEILAALDKLASNFGMKPGFFTEARQALDRTGFMDVHGEHALMDAPMANKVIQNKGATFLDAGQIFFRGGVKSLRAGAWYTAFKEFRDVHPIGAITDDDLKGILSRADLLSHNMSRASTSRLTSGILAIPAQFYTYQLRLMEMMMGKRLTLGEKARLFGVNAALFGAPVSAGLIPGAFPFVDNLRNYANQNGYEAGENFYSTGIMEGLPAALANIIAGHTYNIGERYGVKAPEAIQNIIEGDKTFLQIFGGASFSSLSNTIEQSSGLMHLVMSGIRGDGEALGTATPEDFIGPFKEITSVNSAFKIIAAVRFGNWLSRNNAVLHENTPANAVFEAITGLSETKDADVYTRSQDLRTTRQYENKLFGMFQNRFSLGMQETENKNVAQGQAYFKEAFNILHQGGYPEDRIPEAVAAALEANQTNLYDRTKYNYYLKKILPQQLGQ